MIKVYCDNDVVVHKIFEYLTMSFPTLFKESSLYVKIELTKNIIQFRSDVINRQFNFKKGEDTLVNAIKRAIHDNLIDYIENDDWGILTGMRPTKLFRKFLCKNDDETSKSILKTKYLVREEKAELLRNIVEKELTVLDKINAKDSYSLYINIPFCKSICSYCSFNSMLYSKEKAAIYVDKLTEEISREIPYLKGAPTSIYIGGGTPTSLSINQIYKLLKTIKDNFKEPLEYTVECGRTDTLDEEKLNLLKDFGVDRISLNPQSSKESISKIINRPMNLRDFEKKYALARKLGFDLINMDLILGLPTETSEDMIRSIKYVSDLGPENITIHNLSLKKGSKLFEKNYHFESSIDDVIDFSKKYLHKKSYNPYYMYRQKKIIGNGENIGYSLPGKECIYNILIIEEVQDIIAFGMGSSSKFIREDGKVNQILNFKNLRDYLNRNDEVFNKKLKYYTNGS